MASPAGTGRLWYGPRERPLSRPWRLVSATATPPVEGTDGCTGCIQDEVCCRRKAIAAKDLGGFSRSRQAGGDRYGGPERQAQLDPDDAGRYVVREIARRIERSHTVKRD